MWHQIKRRVEHRGPEGAVIFTSFCRPEDIARLYFEETQARSSRRTLVSKKQSLMDAARRQDANVTLAVDKGNRIIGYGVLEYPRPHERWARVGIRIMMEVSAIEVRRAWRSLGIGREILRLLAEHPLKEKRILYMVGYSWTWDMDEAVNPAAYRDMLFRLFSSAGFKEFRTNEPNVMMRPENLFMARIGKEIPNHILGRFKLVRFDVDRYM